MEHLYVKNMVCDRCKSSVKALLDKLNIDYTEVRLGEIFLEKRLGTRSEKELSQALSEEGFELLKDKDSRLINQIKSKVISFVHHRGNEKEINLSDHLTQNLNKEYSSLSKLFSQVEGRTIENYYIEQRIEKAKELLIYNEFSLSEIAFQLHYSNVAHLSSQFKKVTGMTPSAFKKVGSKARKGLDEI